MKVAAIQLNADFADVGANLVKAENYIREAKEVGAELVLLPEFFTSAIGFSPGMLDVVIDNRCVEGCLKEWAVRYQVIIGGSYLAFDGEDTYNLFQLVFPDRTVYEHKKDIPTQFENCYYTNGDEEHILDTPIGKIGMALCWEMMRYDTLKSLSGQVDFVLAGSCWWDLPKASPPEREALRRYNQNLALTIPITFAKMLGVVVIHANHCGEVTAWNFPGAGYKQTRAFVGAAQMIDKNGDVLARRCFSEGEGIVSADIVIDKAEKRKPDVFPEKYWIEDLPDSYLRAWATLNPEGKKYYEAVALPYYKENLKGKHKRIHPMP